MSRTLSNAVLAEIAADVTGGMFLVQLDFLSGTLYLNTDIRDIAWGGHTWVGAGHVGSISPVEESGEIQPTGVSFTLRSLEYTPLALEESGWQGRPARMWLAFVDQAGAVIPDPVLLFAGRMDRMPMKLGRDGSVTLTCENRLVDWKRTNSARFTDADQRARFAGDTALRFVSLTTERDVPWGTG